MVNVNPTFTLFSCCMYHRSWVILLFSVGLVAYSDVYQSLFTLNSSKHSNYNSYTKTMSWRGLKCFRGNCRNNNNNNFLWVHHCTKSSDTLSKLLIREAELSPWLEGLVGVYISSEHCLTRLVEGNKDPYSLSYQRHYAEFQRTFTIHIHIDMKMLLAQSTLLLKQRGLNGRNDSQSHWRGEVFIWHVTLLDQRKVEQYLIDES